MIILLNWIFIVIWSIELIDHKYIAYSGTADIFYFLIFVFFADGTYNYFRNLMAAFNSMRNGGGANDT